MWAIKGMHEEKIEFRNVVTVLKRYVKLDLVPTHYNFPEFYQF